MRKGIVFLLLVFLSMLMVSCNKPVPLKIKTPVVNPVGGTYTQAQNVTITCETPSVEIRYTLDGSEPSKSSTLYNGTINITSSATLTAKAFKTGWTDSDAVTNNYKLLFQLILTKCIGGAENDKLISIIQTSDGGYVAVGITESNNGDISDNHGSKDGWIIKVDSEGNLIWSRCFGGSNNDNFFSIYETNNGDYLIAGITSSKDNDISDNHGKYDGWIMEVSSTGNKLWSKCFGGSIDDTLNGIIQATDGGYMAVGNVWSTDGDFSGNHNLTDSCLIKVNSVGDKEWLKCFGGNSLDSLWDLIQITDGGYIAVGLTGSTDGDTSGNHGKDDGWIIKLK